MWQQLKRCAYEVWLQKKDEESYEQYKVQRNRARRVVHYAKVNADVRCGRKLTVNFQENKKKMFWEAVNMLRRGTAGKEEGVNAEDGVVLIEKDVVGRRWTEYFKRLLNIRVEGRKPVIITVGMEKGMNVLEEF